MDELAEAIAASEWRRALELALALWRKSRSVELADLVDELAARVGGPQLRRGYELHAVWMRRALPYDAVAIHGLVGAASQQLATWVNWDNLVARHGNSMVLYRLRDVRPKYTLGLFPLVDRLCAIDAWFDDPRAATILTRWLVDMPQTFAVPFTDILYRLIAEQLIRLRDARAIATLERALREPPVIADHVAALHAPILRDALERLSAPSPDPAAAALLASLRPPPPPDLHALWRAIELAPDDDGPRQVLADALLERGDPRGELIALQLAGRGAATVARLRRAHWRDWLGDLANVVCAKGTTWRRGLLHTIRIGTRTAPRWAYAKARGHRELVAVRCVSANQVSPAAFAQLLDGLDHDVPHLDNLDEDKVVALAATRPRWPTRVLTRLFSLRSRRFAETLVTAMPDLEDIDILGTWHVVAPDAVAVLAQLPRIRRIAIPRLAAQHVAYGGGSGPIVAGGPIVLV